MFLETSRGGKGNAEPSSSYTIILPLGIFPEGQITRTGLPNPFLRGVELILKGRDDVAVVPVALDGLWGSIFSRSRGRFFLKRRVR